MVTVGVTLLLCLAIFAGCQWRLQSLTAFFAAVAVTLGIWGTTWALRQGYASIPPAFVGLLASAWLGVGGARATWRACAGGTGPQWLWLLGTCLALSPVVILLALWLSRGALHA